MKEKIERQLIASGSGKLDLKLPGFSVCFTIENNFINAVVLVDLEKEPSVTKEDFDLITKRIDWKSVNGESIDVHTLTLIFTSDLAAARELSLGNHFCWFVDTGEERLVVEEDKCEDFYGLRAQIERYMVAPDLPEDSEDFSQNSPKNFRDEPAADWQTAQEGASELLSPGQLLKSIKQGPFVTYGLVFINVLIFILCIFTGDFLYDKGIFDLESVLEQGQWYRLLTSTFLHADVYHLVGNMLFLYLLGDITERAFGHIKYFIMYMGSGLIASVVSMIFSGLTRDYTQSLGASGAIFGVTGALLWIVIRNHGQQEVITMPKIIFLIAYSLYNGFIGSNVDNAAHVGGLLGGFLLAIVLYRKKKHTNTQQL